MELQIKTGKKVYTLKDEEGNELGRIAFNPGDPNFIARVKGFRNFLESKDSMVEEIDRLNNEGKTEEAIDIMVKLDTELKNKIDEIFDSSVSAVVFGNASCLSRLENGETFVESFLTSVLPEYKKTMNPKGNPAVNKYTKGYANDRGTSKKPKYKRH